MVGCDRTVDGPHCDGCDDDDDDDDDGACGGGMNGICCGRRVPGGAMTLPKALTDGRGCPFKPGSDRHT